jgi:hypothetical protein
MEPGTGVTVQSDEFGRMGHATVRHVQRDKMQYLVGLRFGAAFGLGDPARRKILESVLKPDNAHGDGSATLVRGARKTSGTNR